MIIDAHEIAAELSKRGLAWADTDAAFRALDDVTKTVLSECIAALNRSDSMASKEVDARNSQRYKDHLIALAGARRAANRAKVNYDTYKVYMELLRTNAATDRAQMQLT
jgi:hypothetical protein